MNICGRSMRNVLKSLEVYDTEAPQLSAEIGAYEKGLGFVLDEIDGVIADTFIQTASQRGLETREAVFRPVNSGISPDEKRALLMERSNPRGCFTEDMQCRLAAAGIKGQIIENHLGGMAVNVDSFIGVAPSQAQKEAEDLMPAHLPVQLDYIGERWEAKEGKNLSFDGFDALNRSWNEEEAIN